MKQTTPIIIALAVLLALGGCAAPARDSVMEQDMDAIVEQAEEADGQMEIVDDIEEVKADVGSAEHIENDAGVAGEAVVISGFEFRPHSVTIAAGESVEFVNKDSVPHTATGDAWDTGTLASGQSETIIFDAPGTYDYSCLFHPGMRGQVVVE